MAEESGQDLGIGRVTFGLRKCVNRRQDPWNWGWEAWLAAASESLLHLDSEMEGLGQASNSIISAAICKASWREMSDDSSTG